MQIVLFSIFALMWGSFLNVVAYRWLRQLSIVTPRSRCNTCNTTIYWYDNIPLISWILLQGKCRHCESSISPLYPCIELATLLLFIALYYCVPHIYFFSYAVLCSALIVITRTDLDQMLIMPEFCLYPIPIAYLFSYNGLLPIDLYTSVSGSIFGYILLWSIAKLFYVLTHKQGVGEGDFDLLALIGAFTGVSGVIICLCISSWIGTVIAVLYAMICKKEVDVRIPFAPFLALATIIYICMQSQIHQWLNLLVS